MKIVFLGPLESFNSLRKKINNRFDLVFSKPDKNELSLKLDSADALIDASMKVALDDFLLRSSKLRVISTATTGSDHIDFESAKKNNIKIFTLKDDKDILKNLTPAAELTWALLMALSRNLTSASKHVLDGKWNREEFPGIMLKGKTLGIVGCGRIGQWVSKYANSFGMQILGYDPFLDKWPNQIKKTKLNQLFRDSDFITIHVHLSTETEGMINKDLLSIVKPNCIIINTSRGGLIDEMELLAGLKSGKIAGAGLDVLKSEPDIKENPLVQYAKKNANLIITPHCGGFSLDAVNIVCQRAINKAINFLEN